MNDSFKCIILISCDNKSIHEFYNYSLNSKFTFSKNSNRNYLPENQEFYIFTYITPSSILLSSKKPILGKEIYNNLKKPDVDNNYAFSNNFSFFEFDCVYYTLYPYDEILSENFPFDELINSNTIFIFSSQSDLEKTSSFNSFINIFLNTYDIYSEQQYKIKIICEIIFNKKIFQIESKISKNPKETLENLREIRNKKEQFCQESNLINDNINYILRFQIKESEICFTKLATKNLLIDNITFAYLASDLINCSNSKNNNEDNFNIDKYDKINIISCVSSSKDNYSQSMKEILFMNDIYKEINSIETNKGKTYNIRKKPDSRNNCLNKNINKIYNNSQNQSLSDKNQTLNIKIPDNTIILPEMTSDISETKSNISFSSHRIKERKKEKLSELNSVFSYLENINNSLSNDRAKYDTRISTLEEEIKTLSKENDNLQKNYNLIKEKCDNLEENNNSLNKKLLNNFSLNQKEDNIMNNENNILLNQLKEKDKIIKQLKEENEKLKNKCQIYEDKYIDIKSDNAILNEKINQIEGLLKSLNEI